MYGLYLGIFFNKFFGFSIAYASRVWVQHDRLWLIHFVVYAVHVIYSVFSFCLPLFCMKIGF
jgi:hypothetical protein